jgi:hypothetical protein
MAFSVLIPVGPHPREIGRCADVLASLARFEAGQVGQGVILDDTLAPRPELAELAKGAGFPVAHLLNPRRGRGSGWLAGLTAGVLASLDHLAEHGTTGDFVLKLDTDALLIRACSGQIGQRFAAAPKCAMLGAYRNFPHRRDWAVEREPAPALEKLMRPFTFWRRTHRPWPRLQWTIFRRDRTIRRLILDALLAGYVLGEYCVGGAYALRGATVTAMRTAGLFRDPLQWLPTPLGEDVVVSLLVKRLGQEIADAVAPGEVFGVGNPTLPFAPQEMIEKGYGIVHPVNDRQEWPEAEMRAVFKT